MKYIACSGFPVPVSRYFGEFHAVEISETDSRVPGPGTVRRWLREAPEGFAFTVMAPKDIALGGFNKKGKASFGEVLDVAKALEAKAVVVTGPLEVVGVKAMRVAARAWAESVPSRGMLPIILDLPGFAPEEVDAVVKDTSVLAARNPLTSTAPTKLPFVYYRLHGPAGHRSRYEEPSVEQIGTKILASQAETTFCVFANIDAHSNARQIMTMLAR